MGISFIIPVYKVEKYIEECILSLIGQTGDDLEFIFIDDGSPDNSGKICEQYAKKDKRIRIIRKDNEGVSVARNIGIAAATKEWICFVDGDDKICNDFVVSLQPYTEDLLSDIIIFAFSNLGGRNIPELSQDGKVEIFSDTMIENLQLDCLYHDKHMPRYFFYDFGYAWGKLYRTNFIKKNNLLFPAGIKMHEDQLFNLQALACAKKILGLHKKLYWYRLNANSASNQDSQNKVSELDLKIEVQFHILNKYYPNNNKMWERHKASCFSTLLRGAGYIDNHEERKKYLRDRIHSKLYRDSFNVKKRYLYRRQLFCKYLCKFRAFHLVSKLAYKK